MSESDESFTPFTSPADQWKKIKPFARHMRHIPTPAEQHLWEQLRNRRIESAKFRRQHGIAGFIVDFVCIEHMLVIELDGTIHDEPENKEYDVSRQNQLEEQGFRVLRFPNEQIFEALDDVIEKIRIALSPNL